MNTGIVRFLPGPVTSENAGVKAAVKTAPLLTQEREPDLFIPEGLDSSQAPQYPDPGMLRSGSLSNKADIQKDPSADASAGASQLPELPDLTSIRKLGYEAEFSHGPIESAIRSGLCIWMRSPEGELVPLNNPEQPALLEKIRNGNLSGSLKESMNKLISLDSDGWSFYRVPPALPFDSAAKGRTLHGMEECRLGTAGTLLSLQGKLHVTALSRDGVKHEIQCPEDLGALTKHEVRPLYDIAGRSLDILEKNGFLKYLTPEDRISQIESLSGGEAVNFGQADKEGIHHDYRVNSSTLDSFARAVQTGKQLPGPSSRSLRMLLKRFESQGCVSRHEPESLSFEPFRRIFVDLANESVDFNLAAPGYDYESEEGVICPALEDAKMADWERLADILEGKASKDPAFTALSNQLEKGCHLFISYPESRKPHSESTPAPRTLTYRPDPVRSLDAAAALLRLEKGQPVVLEAPDGRRTTLQNTKEAAKPSFKEEADPERAKLGDALAELEKRGFRQHYPLHVENPRQLWQNYKNPPASRGEVLDRLQKGEAVEFFTEKPGALPTFYEWTSYDIGKMIPFLQNPIGDSGLQSLLKPRDRYLASDPELRSAGMSVNISREKARERLAEGKTVYLLTADGHAEILEKPEDLEGRLLTGKLPENPSRWIHKDPAVNVLISVHATFFQPYPIASASYSPHLFHQMDDTLKENNDLLVILSLHDTVPEGPLRREEVVAGDRKLLDLPEGKLNDMKILSEHIYQSLKSHPEAHRALACLEGHGSGPKGMLPYRDEKDGKRRGISVDDLAKGTHDGLTRFNMETGQQKRLGMMILDSCLMGDFAVLDAMSRNNDVSVLVSSPVPVFVDKDFEHSLYQLLGNPAGADMSDEEIGMKLVEEYKGAGAFGAYRVEDQYVQPVRKALRGLFSQALKKPELFPALRMACDNVKMKQYDTIGCDMIQLAREIGRDPSLSSLHREAHEMEESVKCLVLAQHSPDTRTGNGGKLFTVDGPSIFMPTVPSSWEEEYFDTPLAREIPEYRDFAAMLVQAAI
ncbi:MAG: hypothetical protein AB9903_03740 [Vulcanimicrobiota bacterium]